LGFFSAKKKDLSQGAYQEGKSTIDQIFTLMAMAQKYLARAGGGGGCGFIDLSKSFDYITQTYQFMYSLQELKVLRKMYSKLNSPVKLPNSLTTLFQCITGTRQGCILSPVMFIL